MTLRWVGGMVWYYSPNLGLSKLVSQCTVSAAVVVSFATVYSQLRRAHLQSLSSLRIVLLYRQRSVRTLDPQGRHMLTSKTETRTGRILKSGICASRSVETVFESSIDCWRRLADSVAEAFEPWSTTCAVFRVWVTRFSSADYA